MAQLDIREAQDGIQEAIRQLQKADLFTDENLKPILSTGTEIMLSSVKSAFVQAGHNNRSERRTGQTFQHFTKARKVSRDKRGVPYMHVTISGKDSRGQRYGTKGFVLNYGRRTGGKIPADYYWSNAVQATWKRVNEAMTDKAEEIINSNR